MIRIDKGSAPAGVADKCAQVTKHLKDIYAELGRIYAAKAPTGDVELTKADEAELAKKWGGTVAQLPTFVLGRELVDVLEPTALPSGLDSLFPAWKAEFTRQIAAYQALRTTVQSRWTAEVAKTLPNVAADQRRALAEQVAVFYQYACQHTGRPFTDVQQAYRPAWFEPSETSTWKVFADMTEPARVQMQQVLFSAYQRVLDGVRAEYLSGADRWLTPAVWMVADTAAPDPSMLFGYARNVFSLRLTGREDLSPAMTADEVRALTLDLVGRLGEAALFFVGVHTFGVALDEAAAPKRHTVVRPLLGFRSDTFDSALYSGGGIKEALMTTHFGKCVFCEAKVRATAHGDVEHFRPKAGYDQGYRFNYDGYFWRAYDWANLFYSCQVCNQVYKQNHFPVLPGNGAQPDRKTFLRDDVAEEPVLIDPGAEDPRQFIRFDPRTGYAYPYDLLRAFLAQTGTADAEAVIWREPRLIPDASGAPWLADPAGQPGRLTAADVDNGRWVAWHAKAAYAQLRGSATISLLGLNRTELVRQRLTHLRGLRALFLTTGAERSAAQAALDAAVRPSAEFSSLAIDAVRTWQAESDPNRPAQAGAYPWLTLYQQSLSTEPVYTLEEQTDLAKDLGIMYFIADGSDPALRRRVVYLNQKTAIDENSFGPGLLLQIPEEDRDRPVTGTPAKSGPLTIKDLLDHDPVSVHHKFRNDVTATGPFSSPVPRPT